MDIIFILLPIALILGAISLMWMLWGVKAGQFEDMEGPAHRILFDDDREMIPETSQETQEDDPPKK